MNKPQMLGLSLLLIMVLSACGEPAPTPSPRIQTQSDQSSQSNAPQNPSGVKGYVLCVSPFVSNDLAGTGRNDRIGVIGYDVTGPPVTTGTQTLAYTTTGKRLIYGSPCYYTEDDPKFAYVDWQTR